ncbi:MAG: CoA transferase, partial [Oscillospiraceae bacterium]|jgi:crotonobetainyl-CoA:carnitine CoA-transferase CaiB-like acyl-CoA transferase
MFNSAPYGLFEGAGKRYIAICAPTPPIWKNLCIAMQREDLLENERYSDMSKRIENRYELVDIIQAWLSKYENASEAIEILRSHDVPCAEVKADWEMHECPQLASRHYFEDIPFPKSIVEETGRKQYKIKGLPFKTSSDAENPDYLPLPEVGEHNYDVYGTVATKEEIDALLDRWHNKFHKY